MSEFPSLVIYFKTILIKENIGGPFMIWINQDVYFPFLILSVPQIELLVAEIKLGSYREEENSYLLSAVTSSPLCVFLKKTRQAVRFTYIFSVNDFLISHITI